MAHYHRAQFLYGRRDLAGALREFEGAYALDPKPKLGERVGMHFEDYDPEFEIAGIEAQLGHWGEAKRLLALCASHGYTARSQNAEEFERLTRLVRSVDQLRRQCRESARCGAPS